MCSVFQTGGVRKASQKSWLVAAITQRMSSAATPNGMKGKPRICPKFESTANSASQAVKSFYEKN